MRSECTPAVAAGQPAPDTVEDALAPGALRELREAGDIDILCELLPLFRSETDELLAVLRCALADGDAEQLARASHSLKGSSGTIGAAPLSRLAAQMERLGQACSTDGAVDLLTRIEAEVERVYTALVLEMER